jgi:putative ABC transport system permease protein
MNAAAQLLGGNVHFTWRFRIDETSLTMANLQQVADAVHTARRQTSVPDAYTVTSLDTTLTAFAALAASTRALLAVVQAGLVVTLFGLVVLAALAAATRRQAELALLRSRGASLARLGGRLLLESGPIVTLAVIAGYLLGSHVPGRSDGSAWVAVPFGVAAALTAPVLAILAHRRVSVSGARGDLARPAVSPRRVTAELTLVVIAVIGVLLLRRRGLGTGVDLYLVVLPALIAAAAAVIALRLLPFPLRLLSGLAARARGAVAFLGLTRAGRAAPASAGPVAVLVVAVSVAAFCAAVDSTVSAARDRVADMTVPGAALVQGQQFPPDAEHAFAAVPGVESAAALTLVNNAPLALGALRRGRSAVGVTVLIADGPALASVLAASGNSQRVPDALLTGARADDPDAAVPAVVSPGVATDLASEAGQGYVIVQGQLVAVQPVATVETFPGLGADNARFVILPQQALAAQTAQLLVPTAVAVAGRSVDAAALERAGDDEQRARMSDVRGEAVTGDLPFPTSVVTWRQARADLERGGMEPVLDYAFGIGLSAGLLLALLAVAFAVANGARSRGQALSRLRTMGLAPGQGRRLLAYELLPMVLLGALVGAAVGTALPVLLGPALGLSAFSDGGTVAFTLDPALPSLAFGLVLVGVVLAMLVEAALNRRARLGAVLRLGGES